MKIDLTDTTASKINKALVQGRRAIGTPAVGMVLTLVIVTDEENAYDALKAAERRLARAPLAHAGRHQARLAARPATARSPAWTPRCGWARTRAPARRSSCGCTARCPTTPSRSSCRCCCRTRRWSSGGRWTRRSTRRRTRWARSPSAGSPTPTPPSSRYRSWRPAPTPTPPATPTWPGPGSRPWRSMLAAALDQVTCEVSRPSRWRARSSTRAASCWRCGSRTGWTSRSKRVAVRRAPV